MAGISTKLIHDDDSTARVPDVVQPINVSTTYRYSNNPDDLVPVTQRSDEEQLSELIYSRLNHPNSVKAETILEGILGGHVVVYSSGLAAFFAALTYYNPKTLAIGKGYHGCHGIANIFSRLNGLNQIGLDDDFSVLQKGDIVHLETPVNPEGTAFDIKYYADKAHERGAFLTVDATFAPPPLQDPFLWGADLVLHSATKYFGGHSDLLAGVLVTKDPKVKLQLFHDRVYLGTNIPNLESYLLNRSLRTYELRILKQSKSAEEVVKYLNDNIAKYPVLTKVYHASLQTDAFVKEQLTGGYGPTFSIEVSEAEIAKTLPSRLKYFHHATSLGGVESLIEWRALTDASVQPTLLRISIGIEDSKDLIEDLDQALRFEYK
ncbi:unnamed protein product [Kuraishia capsulata CBS 1993]|uniref:Cystathionine gamma-synthase n=1 Tax=Kuraishia capsulata CBS 1993 TaxID=1382522 RepID=W6MUB9_9ASCO|nr:uncharacterized protein KUCA_T00001495001 [Kuraishia capsulata CBS 1993]CDK25525.1 unnamed protein product [Kuraishia capsulata CBS 1993]